MSRAPTGSPSADGPVGIAVVIPSYNHERYLAEAIGSIRRQTLPVDEIVVVDDGSTDGSRALLEALAGPDLRVFEQENRGAHAALNRAIECSRADYLAILNSDDVLEPTRIEHAWGVARGTGAALVCGEVLLIGDDGADPPPDHDIVRWYAEARRVGRDAPSLSAALETHNVAVTTSNFFLHRELWARLEGFRAYRYVHDYDFLLRASALVPERLVYEPSLRDVRYRVHGANTISEDHERALAERARMLEDVGRPSGGLGRRLAGVARRVGAARAGGGEDARAVGEAVDRRGALRPVRGPDAVGGGAAPGGGARRRVGLLVSSLGTGGLEEVVGLLAQALPAAGWEAEVFCSRAGGGVADRLMRSGVRVTVGDDTPEACVAWARSSSVDVVSGHYAAAPLGAALEAAGVPVVETVHNTYAWHDDALWAAERTRAEHATGVIAVSNTAAAYWSHHTDRVPDAVVPNAVHPGRAASVPRAFARRALELADDDLVLAAVGRITDQKNPEGLLAGFERARASVPDARLILVGPPDPAFPWRALRARYRRLFSSGAVRPLGPRDDVHVALSAADAFVSASWYEGWSVAASEAAWVGRPLVLTECGGAVDLVGAESSEGAGGARGQGSAGALRRGARGWVVPNPAGDPLAIAAPGAGGPGDRAAADRTVAGLAHAIGQLARERDAWRGREADIAAYARSTLSPIRMARRYAAVFEEAARS